MTTTALYRHFDESGTLLYVGVSLSPPTRTGQHRRDSPWWHLVKTITLEHYPTRAQALAAEAEAIKKEQPQFNRSVPRPSPPPESDATAALEQLVLKLDELLNMSDSVARARLAAELTTDAPRALRSARAAAVREAVDGGMRPSDLARALGVSRGAVDHLLHR